MARKRPTEDPLPSSSSEEENENEDDEVEEEESSAEDDDKPKNDAKEDEEDDEDVEENEEEEEVETPSKKQKTDFGKDGSDSESDTESEKSLPSPNISDFAIRPIVSKPQKSAPKSTPNPKLKPIATEASSKPQKPPSSASNAGAGNVKTPGGARLWSEADEIAILKGMIEYKSKKGSDPYSDSSGFHDFIKKSIQADVSKNQLTEKIRRLKKKFQNNAEKGQNGNDPVFSKPHDQKSFELSKKIWGNETNGKISKSQKKMKTSGSEEQEKSEANGGITLALPSLKNNKEANAGVFTQVSCDKEINAGISTHGSCDSEKVEEAFWKDYPCLKQSLEMGKWGNVGACPMNMEMFGLIEREKLKEMEGEFRKLKIEELKLFLKRLELVQEQARAALDVIKGSNV